MRTPIREFGWRVWMISLTTFGIATAAAAERSPTPAPASETLTACTLPDVARAARCGSILVPEDRQRPNGRKLAIRVAVVRALRAPVKNDPIVILQGGPGESAVDDASVYARWLAPVLVDRDLLLIDQRGAGGSAPLTCKMAHRDDPTPLFTDIFPPAAVQQCAAALAKRADLTKYGYSSFIEDLEEIRKFLGYGRFNLFAGSYGTRAAQVYLRRFPDSVRTAYLGSVVPIDIATPITMARTAQIEMNRLFDACAADEMCARAYPRLRFEFKEVVQRISRGEAKVQVTKQGGQFVLHSGPVASWLRAKLYRPSSAAMIPWAVHRAYEGDWTSIAEEVASGTESSLSFGLFFGITCNEDVRFIDGTKIAESSRDTFVGDTRVRQQQTACRFWPSSPLPAGYRTPVRSTVPALLVAGEADGGTPVWFTDHAAKNFLNSAIVLAPGQGHTEWSPCIASRYFALVQQGRLAGKTRTRCPPVPRPPFKL